MQRTFSFDEPPAKKPRQKKASKALSLVVEIPATLAASPEFMEEWAKWLEYRKTEKRKPVSDSLKVRQLKHFEQCGSMASVAAIKESMLQGWTGVFPKPWKTKTDLLSPVDRWLKETDQ